MNFLSAWKMATSTRIARRVVKQVGLPLADIPTFLCPAILRTTSIPLRLHKQSQSTSPASQRRNLSSTTSTSLRDSQSIRKPTFQRLPQQCAGCGALSQTIDSEGPGFYTLTRKSVRTFVEGLSTAGLSAEDAVVKAALERAGPEAVSLNLGDLEAPG